MLVHLLCPGPSLAAYAAPTPRPLTIAVNRAALRFQCDWWAACDYPMVRDNRRHVLGAPAVCTAKQQFWKFPELVGVCIEDDLWPKWRMPGANPGGYSLYSFSAAMILALHVGATRLDVFGADWKGTADYDGAQAGENRSDDRWATEARFFAEMSTFLQANGCEVNRVRI
jgi:hypothetical protein